MKKILLTLTVFIIYQTVCFGQIEKNTHNLLSKTGEISNDVKEIIKRSTDNKQFVFLGESFHQSGADLIYKTKFVEYLVNELGYKDIIFESDFYGLYKDKNKQNIYGTWSAANQCTELFDFIEKNDVTLWGCDSKLHSIYSRQNFVENLEKSLSQLNVTYSKNFIQLSQKIIELQFKAKKEIKTTDLDTFSTELNQLINSADLPKNNFLLQALKNLKSSTLIYTAKNIKISITERDEQMADNLQYLAMNFPDKKFIVWAANAHIAKTENEYMGGATMGSTFLKLNPRNSYHIAFASIKMPYRKLSKIEKKAKNDKNLLHYLPNLDNDYFIDAKQAVAKNIKLKNNIYYAKLWSGGKRYLKTKWLEHFDAIVYIENGELTTYRK